MVVGVSLVVEGWGMSVLNTGNRLLRGSGLCRRVSLSLLPFTDGTFDDLSDSFP